ncbi:MAG TPA: response regulator transcription factor [Ktedonobacterales bacterium]|jgi:DNA-binding NarL/FixJ family response regulator
MTTVVLVDDHPIVREGIRRLLAAQQEYIVIEETDRGVAGLEAVERLRPDLAIVDLLLPDLNGIEVTRRMLRAAPQTRVVALSMYADELHVVEALRAGATAYLVKGASAEEILTALREALAGRRYLSAPLTERIIEEYFSQAPIAPRKADRYELLTAREREVLEWLARGLTYAEIADKLTISPRTAETHRTNLMRKLDLRTSADITLYAVQRGLIDPEQN